MAQISSYPILDPQLGDKVLGSNTVDSAGNPVEGNPTVQYTLSSVKTLVDQNFIQQLETQNTSSVALLQSGDALIFGGVDVTGSNVTYTANTGKVTFVTKGTYYIEQQYCVSGTPPGQIFSVFKTMSNGTDQVGPTVIERYAPNASTDRKIVSISNIVNVLGGTYYIFYGLWDVQGAQPTLTPQLVTNNWATEVPSAYLKISKLI
jgi:hypothetical protein